MARRHVFHVIFFKDRDWWVAQCLEKNLATASQDPRELPGKLEAVLKVQIEADQDAGIEPLSALPQAPPPVLADVRAGTGLNNWAGGGALSCEAGEGWGGVFLTSAPRRPLPDPPPR